MSKSLPLVPAMVPPLKGGNPMMADHKGAHICDLVLMRAYDLLRIGLGVAGVCVSMD